ncbi:MAG TPA: Cys-Gln thioester bond-forming surface protein [Cryptosporangiaceae bacterium]|nr:Cys-Gln thioester bond-forming surface protein [Cryptosporangiaceae bacterium]
MSSHSKPVRLAAALVGAALAVLAWSPAANANPLGGLPLGGLPLGGLPTTGLPIDALPVGALPTGNLTGAIPGTVSSVVLEKAGTVQRTATGLLQTTGLQQDAVQQKLAGYRLVPAGVPGVDTLSSGALTTTAVEKVNWVVHNSYPQMALNTVAAKAGLPAISKEQAIAAAQAAIFHYTTGADLASAGNLPAVSTVYGLLTGAANKGLALGAPTALLTKVDGSALPANLQGTAGQLLGPLLVNPAVAKVVATVQSVTPATPDLATVRMVNAKRQAITSAKGGDKVFLLIPEGVVPGSANLRFLGDPQAAVGKIVNAVSTGDVSSLLVLADTGALPLRQTQKIQWGAAQGLAAVKMSATCAAGQVALLVNNAKGAAPVPLVINKRRVTVPAGSTKVVAIPSLDGKYSVPVTDGISTQQVRGVQDCASGVTPIVMAAPDCKSGVMSVLLDNAKGVREAAISVNGRTMTVPAGMTRTVAVPIASDGSYLAEVAGAGGLTKQFSGQLACAQALELASAKTSDDSSSGAVLVGVAAGVLALLALGSRMFLLRRRTNA